MYTGGSDMLVLYFLHIRDQARFYFVFKLQVPRKVLITSPITSPKGEDFLHAGSIIVIFFFFFFL